VVAVFLCYFAAVALKRKFYDKKKEEQEDGVLVEEDVVVVEEGYVKMGGEKDKKDEGRPVSPVIKEEGDVVVIEQGKGYKSMDDSKV
jgi:hypothetical protein